MAAVKLGWEGVVMVALAAWVALAEVGVAFAVEEVGLATVWEPCKAMQVL